MGVMGVMVQGCGGVATCRGAFDAFAGGKVQWLKQQWGCGCMANFSNIVAAVAAVVMGMAAVVEVASIVHRRVR